MTTWILVADGSRGRLFSRDERKPWVMVRAFDRPECCATGGELAATEPGRQVHSPAAGHRAAMEKMTPQEIEGDRFGRELADVLEKGLNGGSYETLVLVAPPTFLGRLRAV